MNIYLWSIIISVALMIPIELVVDRSKEWKDKRISEKIFINLFLFLAAIPPFLIGSLRFSIGKDYSVYSSLQIPLVLNGYDKSFATVEPIYQIIIKISEILSKKIYFFYLNPYQWVFIITQFTIILFMFLTIRKINRNFILTTYLFYSSMFFLNSLNLMRQSIATAIFLYALISYFKDKNFKKYVFWIIIAALNHKISLVFILVPFFKKININKKISLFLPIISYLLMSILRIIFEVLASLLSYEHYFGSSRDTGEQGWSVVFLNYAILFIMYVLISNQKNISQNTLHWNNLFFFAQLITTILAVVAPVLPNSYRLVILFGYVPIISLPYFFSFSNKYFLRIAVIGIYSIFLYYNFYIIHSTEFFPYKDIFGNIYF